jgi:hypothetical protein
MVYLLRCLPSATATNHEKDLCRNSILLALGFDPIHPIAVFRLDGSVPCGVSRRDHPGRGLKAIQIAHEIHRGKFSFHPLTTLPYLDAYPNLRLTADLSHWCCVCSSYLQDQQSTVRKALSRTAHIHARVGFTEGPQVNDFRAPEWREALAHHLRWWDIAIAHQQGAGASYCTITPEFGPQPYMPSLPYTRQPLADQWDLNVTMMALLRTRYSGGEFSYSQPHNEFPPETRKKL